MLGSIVDIFYSAVIAFFSFLGASSLGAVVAQTSSTVENTPPEIISAQVTGNIEAVYGDRRIIKIAGEAEDRNSEQDIRRLFLVFYRDKPGNTYTCAEDPNDCIYSPDCPLDVLYGNAVQVFYQCQVSVEKPYSFGDWIATLVTVDAENATATLSVGVPVFPILTQEADGTKGGGILGSGYATTTQDTISTSTIPVSEKGGEIYVPRPAPEIVTSTTTGTTTDTATIFDPITAFYNRIEEEEPAERTQPNHTESYGEPIIVSSTNSGLVVYDFSTTTNPTSSSTLGVIVEIPPGASADWITIYVEAMSAQGYPLLSAVRAQTDMVAAVQNGLRLGDRTGITPVGFTVFKVYAKDSKGNLVPSIKAAARITLIVPEDLSTKKNLGLYRLDVPKNTWVPQTYIENTDHTLTFHTAELGVYALFDTTPIDEGLFPNAVAVKLFCTISILILLIILGGLLTLLVIYLVRKEKEKKEQEIVKPTQEREFIRKG